MRGRCRASRTNGCWSSGSRTRRVAVVAVVGRASAKHLDRRSTLPAAWRRPGAARAAPSTGAASRRNTTRRAVRRAVERTPARAADGCPGHSEPGDGRDAERQETHPRSFATARGTGRSTRPPDACARGAIATALRACLGRADVVGHAGGRSHDRGRSPAVVRTFSRRRTVEAAAPALGGMHRAHPVVDRPVASPTVQIEQLPAVAQQPVVVQRHDDRHAALRERAWELGGETSQVLDVDDVWPGDSIENRARPLRSSAGFAVALLERTAVTESVVDAKHLDDAVRLAVAQRISGRSRIGLAGEDEHLVVRRQSQRARRGRGYSLRSRRVASGGKPWTTRRMRIRRPGRAGARVLLAPSVRRDTGRAATRRRDLPPARSRASLRRGSRAASRRWTGSVTAIARTSDPSCGTVERPNNDCSRWCTSVGPPQLVAQPIDRASG